MNTQYLVNINTSTIEELIAVPGIGPALAQRIIDNRPYQDLNDLVRVSGIGETSIEELTPYLTMAGDEIQTVNLKIGMDEDFSTAESGLFETAETEIIPNEENENVEPDLDLDEPSDEASVQKDESFPVKDEIFYDLSEEEMADPASAFEEVDVIEEKESPNESETLVEEDLPTEENEKETETAPRYVTRQQLTWSVIAAVVGSVLLTLALTLGILAFMNGDLRYATWNDAKHLSSQITDLSERNDSMQNEADQMRKRMDAMEVVAGRVTMLEETTQTIQDTLTDTQTELETATEHINAILKDMTSFQQRFNDYNESFLGIYNAILPLVEPMLEGGQNK